MLFFKKICYIYLHDRLKGRGGGGVGLICVRITETVAAKKKPPLWSLMAKKVNIIPVTS